MTNYFDERLGRRKFMYARVIVDVPTMQTNQPYTYQIPSLFSEVLVRGMRVVVPFGKGNRLVQGFVTEIVDEAEKTDKLKDIMQIVELEPVLNDELLQLAIWVANYNFAFRISVLQTMLPNVMRAKYSKVLRLVEPDGLDDLPEIKALFIDRDEVPFDTDNVDMALVPTLLKLQKQRVIEIGYVVKNRAKVKKINALKPIKSVEFYEKQRSQLRPSAVKQARLLSYLVQSPRLFVPVKEVIKSYQLDYASVKQAESKGWLIQKPLESYRIPKLSTPVNKTQPLTLNAEQQEAYTNIANNISQNDTKTFLLEGVTGSGKTEIYLQTIAKALTVGQTALMLVPEITLTPQMVRRVKSRFGDDVAVMHSGLSDGERYDEWRRVQRSEVHVVVGARSAVFAPLKNIGLIIIDEEHESSYKQDENPRYHARDVAQWRAKYHHATLVLGSATPSLESRARAQKGVYQLLTLNHRATNSTLPETHVIDMREAIKQGGDDVFSPQLLAAVKDRLAKKEQIVLMLNRRGYANFLVCRECGYTPRCVNCDVALTVHKDISRLVCHYCGYSETIPTKCKNCGSTRIRQFGTGTQKVAEQLQQQIPQARVLRMDVDTTRKKGSVDRLLTAFGNHEADILLGTQMIAKGLDFANVTLVGVLNADTTLSLPDFRASERTFQLLTQVSGRAGRGDKAGNVIMQTFNPDHYAIQFARQQDYEAFYHQEMTFRHAWRYTPYYFTVQIKFAHEKVDESAKAAYEVANWLQNIVNNETIMLGPATGTIPRIKNKYYYRLVIKYRHDDKLMQALASLMQKGQQLQKKGVTIMIDREPINFM